MTTVTSSFRMSQELHRRLEETARTMRKPKNWIISQALDEYLQRKGLPQNNIYHLECLMPGRGEQFSGSVGQSSQVLEC